MRFAFYNETEESSTLLRIIFSNNWWEDVIDIEFKYAFFPSKAICLSNLPKNNFFVFLARLFAGFTKKKEGCLLFLSSEAAAHFEWLLAAYYPEMRNKL